MVEKPPQNQCITQLQLKWKLKLKFWIHHSNLSSSSWSYREHLRKCSSNTSACLCSCIWDFLHPVYCLCPEPAHIHTVRMTPGPILSQIFQTCNSVKLRWIQLFCRKKIPFYYFCWKLRILTKDYYFELNRSYYLGKNWKLIKILILDCLLFEDHVSPVLLHLQLF